MTKHRKKKRRAAKTPIWSSENPNARWVPLESLPLEVWQQILILLPINGFLMQVAQASRIFCEILLHDWRFAHRHMKFFLTTYAEDEDQFYYEILDEQPNDLPLPYAASMLRSCFTDYSYGNDLLLDSSLYFSVSKHAGEKIVSFLEDFLDTDARAHMLEWMVAWAGISKQTVMDILRNDKDVPVPRRFMYTAAKNGWTDVGQLLLNRGFKVMPKAGGVLAPVGVLADDSILTHAVRHGQNEMVALLVQDKQVNMSNHINSLYCLSKSLDIAETLFLAPRVKNGEFLLSIARGDVDAVTKHLDSSANFNHANPNKSCLSVAIHFDQPDVLTVLMQDKRLLLTDSHHQNLLRDSAVGQSWKVFRKLIGHPQSNPFQKKWDLYKLLCSGDTYEEDRLEAFKAFVSREDVKKCMDCARWGVPLQLACEIGAKNLFEYVLAEAGDTVDINRSAVVGAAIKRASTRQSGVQILKTLARRKLFRPLDTEGTGQLVSALRAPTSPLAEYILSKDQRFFSPAYLQRAFNDACKSKVKSPVETLSQLPGIQIRRGAEGAQALEQTKERIARRWVPIESLPLEIWQQILILLPVNMSLMPVAQAARIFSDILLHDWHFAHMHMKFFATMKIHDAKVFYRDILELREELPLPYAASVLRSCFTGGSSTMNVLRYVFQFSRVTRQAGEKIIEFLVDLLDTDSLAHMLEWMATWDHISKQPVLEILRNHTELAVPTRVMYTAAAQGWTDVGELILSRGFNVTFKGDGTLDRERLLAHAIRHGHKEMVALLLQDSQIDLSPGNYRLCRLSKSLDIAETLFLDRRVKNGEFLLSIARGDVDAVTKHLDSSATSTLADPRKVCLLVAIHFDQPDVLTVLLKDKRLCPTDHHHQNLLRDSAVAQSWKVFRNLIGHPRSNPFRKEWRLYELLCSGDTYDEDRLEAFKAFVSREDVKQCMDCARWTVALEFACEIGAMNLLEYVLAEAGDEFDFGCADVIGPAIMHANTRDGGDQMLSILASHKSFRPRDTLVAYHFVNSMPIPTSPLAKYVLSKDQRFFSPVCLQKAFDDGCKFEMKGVVEILIQLPGIQVSPSQSEVVESLKHD
ncbi:hypothetical protein HDU80_009034 [Chytriomyces hyalinus]|nr:hypothetical protein HDU80_009034 [Chytriomyces hyalinus]